MGRLSAVGIPLPFLFPDQDHFCVSNFFITEEVIPSLLDIYASRLRTKKGFLDDKTSLHIFVLTLRCNQNCTYCQASSQEEQSKCCSMSLEDMSASVQMMFHSPSPHLTMEFQGGEPSLEINLIRHGIETAEEINKVENRKLTYVLCTNCRSLSDELLELCKQYGILISTSLDGPSFLHNKNRGREDRGWRPPGPGRWTWRGSRQPGPYHDWRGT